MRPDKPDTRTTKQKLKSERQEAMREQLRSYGLLQQVLETIKKVEDAAGTIEANELNAHKFTTDTRMKLINKYLPDLKSVELTQDPDSDGWIVRVERVVVDAKPTD